MANHSRSWESFHDEEPEERGEKKKKNADITPPGQRKAAIGDGENRDRGNQRKRAQTEEGGTN